MEVQVVSKAMRLLMTLAESPGSETVSSLARKLDADKSSVSRLLRTLESKNFVENSADSRGYTLGSALVYLGQETLRRQDLRSLVKPILEDLSRDTGECAHLAKLSNSRALYVDQISPPIGVNVDAPVGTLAPLHCTALGKVLLAFQPMNRAATLLGTIEFTPYTRRTIRGIDQLRTNIDQILEQGVAVDDEEFSVGVRCIASAICNHDGEAVGAIGISGPSPRVTDERIHEWGHRIRECATEASTKLGYRIDSGESEPIVSINAQ